MIIRSATQIDAATLANAHIKVFPNFFLSTLGLDFLKVYYRALINYPETLCYVAEEKNVIVGYVVGRMRTKGYLKRVVKSNMFTFMLQGIKLLFTKPGALLRLVMNLEKKSDEKIVVDNQDYAEIGLIGVNPEMKGKGIGRALLNTLEECLRSKSVEKLSLTTDFYNNDTTLMAYKAWGFNVLYEFTAYPNRKMYRLIKTIS